MKNYKIIKLLCTLCFLLEFASCESNDDLLGVRVIDFTAVKLIKLHGGSEKSWKLTAVIMPEKFRDAPSSINKACVADDIHTFSVATSAIYESTEEFKIDLRDRRCFETFTEAEHFEGKLEYYLYTLKWVEVMKTTLFLKKWSIANNVPMGTTTGCFGAIYPLVELTEDRMVFSNATFIGDQTFGYVFEKTDKWFVNLLELTQ